MLLKLFVLLLNFAGCFIYKTFDCDYWSYGKYCIYLLHLQLLTLISNTSMTINYPFLDPLFLCKRF